MIRRLFPSLHRHLPNFATTKIEPLLPRIAAMEQDSQLNHKVIMELGRVSMSQREEALKIIVEKIKAGTFNSRLLMDETLLMHLKKHPKVYFDAFFDRVHQQLEYVPQLDKKGQKVAIKDTNNSFLNCFEILKQVPKEECLDQGAALHRSFAFYHSKILSPLVPKTQLMEVLAKAVEFYKSSLNKLSLRVKELTKEDVVRTEEQQAEIDERARTYSNTVLDLFEAIEALKEQELKNRSNKDDTEEEREIHQGLFKLVPILSQSIEFDKSVKNLKQYELNHFKIRKIYHELAFHKAAFRFSQRNSNAVKKVEEKFESNMMQLRKQIEEVVIEERNLEESKDKMVQMSTILLGIDYNMLVYKREQGFQDLEECLGVMKRITDLFPEEEMETQVRNSLVTVLEVSLGYDVVGQVKKLEKKIEKAEQKTQYQSPSRVFGERISRAERLRRGRAQAE